VGGYLLADCFDVLPLGVAGLVVCRSVSWDSSGGRVSPRFEPDSRRDENRPCLLGGVISTLAHPAVDDEFSYAKCEECCQAIIVASTSTLADAIRGAARRFVQIKGDLVTFGEWFFASLARRFAK